MRTTLLCLTLLVAPMMGCGGKSTSAGNTLIYGRGGDARTLDPVHAQVGESVKVVVNLYDTLVTYHDETLDLVPSLAEKWEMSEDGLTWTFHLRKGVKFHDGTALNSEAVVFTFERLLEDDHPYVFHGTPPYRPDFQMIEKVEGVDAQTVKFHLKTPSAVLLKNLAMFSASIVSPTGVKKHGDQFGNHPVGTGPFQFKSWTRQAELVLVANDDHWRGRPPMDRVIFVPVEKSAVRVEQLKRGQIHIADNLPPAEVDTLAKVEGMGIQKQNGMNVGYLTMQLEKPPLNIPEVRWAIGHAIDKQRLVEVAYAGHAIPAVTMVPPTMWAHHEGLVDRQHDIAKAKELLQSAAKDGGFELPLKLKLFVMGSPRPYMQSPQQTALFIKDSLGEIGIEADVVSYDIGEYFQRLSRGEHDLGLSGWTTDNADPDNMLYSLLDSDNISDNGGNNLSRYDNPQVHELLLGAQQESDEEKRKQMYLDAQEMIFTDAPTIPLVHTDVRIVHTTRLKGYKLHPSDLKRLRLAYFEDVQK